MHPIPLLTTLILPLSILAAPSPADPIVPVEARYRITQASVRYLRDSSRGFVNKDFDFSIRGTKDGNVDIYCAGGVDVVDKVETVKMNCPQDPRLEVWVSAGTDATFDLTVQYLDMEKAFGRANYADANWDRTTLLSPYIFTIYTAKQGWEISSKVG
ncbi:hypothetical protein XANCAGTX0491_008874 [Xanthoria calcicola]